MAIDIRFFPLNKLASPDHIRVTRSISGETGTITFTFNNVKSSLDSFFNIENLTQFEIKTSKHFYSTKDIRILWANGKPYVLQAVFVIQNKELFDYFFQNLQVYAFEKGLVFFQNE